MMTLRIKLIHKQESSTNNHLVGALVIRVWDEGLCSPVVSSSSFVIVNMMTIRCLYDIQVDPNIHVNKQKIKSRDDTKRIYVNRIIK